MPDPERIKQIQKMRGRLNWMPPIRPDATAVARRVSPPVEDEGPLVDPARIAAARARRQAVPLRPMVSDSDIAQATEFIAGHEGFREQAYKDLNGAGHPWTVGYGRTGEGVDSLTRMPEPEARRWLAERVRQDAQRLIEAGVTPHPSLLSFVYNAGHERLRSSGALDAALQNDWKAVGEAMMRVVRGRDAQHNSVVLPGLVRRRQEEVRMLQNLLGGNQK